MNSPASPLALPEDFPSESGWDRFFMGIPVLGPDLSFFKDLESQQAARTEEFMALWTDEQERRIATSLGRCLQKQWGWKSPYFIPADQIRAVLGGPDAWTYMELDLADAFELFEEQLAHKMNAGFWESALDWENRNGNFQELVRKIAAESNRSSTTA